VAHSIGRCSAARALYSRQLRAIQMVKGRPVVAIIDSDPATRKSTETLLSSFGFNIELYASAGEFIEASAATQARCLLMSVELCEMSGIDLARYLLKAGVNIPTVYVSANKNEVAHRAAIELGCVAFLEKPFGSMQLIEAIATASSNPFFER
jgi:FixJ family two-component response regulator